MTATGVSRSVGDEEPEACPEGHRNDDPELSALSGVSAAEEAEVTA